jgi:drug/metabolite transporter (DMT)-like permease
MNPYNYSGTIYRTLFDLSNDFAPIGDYSRGLLRSVLGKRTESRALRLLLAGTVFDPTLGMLCYIAALNSAPAGITTTITFLAPLLVIPIGARRRYAGR